MATIDSSAISRRDFLGTTATVAAACVAGTPFISPAFGAAAKYRRPNVVGSQGGSALKSYAAAIKAMLELPADDPRNWYRIALTHIFDCPHGNWWFLVWHRGYLGHFEQICRDLSGDENFALPYWDWTETSRVPDAMFDGVLTPTDPLFLNSKAEFDAKVRDAVEGADYWTGTGANGKFDDQSRFAQLLGRGIRSYVDLSFDIFEDPRYIFVASDKGLFFDRDHARGLTREAPNLDYLTSEAVSAPTVLNALAPKDFVTFASPKALSHQELSGFGVLESQPHNKIHNNVGGDIYAKVGGKPKLMEQRGGFMHEFLSPVDPLFFLHHANIDRLWDVWTRKQLAYGYPILPDGYLDPNALDQGAPRTDYKTWGTEKFVFFVGPDKMWACKTNAADYQNMSVFGYDYEPGFGEIIVPRATAAALSPRLSIQRFTADIGNAKASGSTAGTVRLPASVLSATGPGGPSLFAKVTVALPSHGHDGAYTVVINAPAGAHAIRPESPHYVSTLTMFGHHTVHCPITFVVPISGAINNLRSMNALGSHGKEQSLNFRVMLTTSKEMESTHEDTSDVEVLSVVVEVH